MVAISGLHALDAFKFQETVEKKILIGMYVLFVHTIVDSPLLNKVTGFHRSDQRV